MRMRGVPTRDFLATAREAACFLDLSPDALNPVVLDFLPVMRRVGFSSAVVEISFAHFLRRQTDPARDAVEDFLDDEHPLRSAESAERGVGNEMRFRRSPAEFDVRDV